MSRDLLEEEDAQRSTHNNNASAPSAFDFDPSRLETGSDQEEDFANDEAWGDEEDVVEEVEVDAADLETFNQFITPTMNDDSLLTHGWDGKPSGDSTAQGPGTNLADLILSKIAEKEAMQGGRHEEMNPVEEDYELPPKVVEVFTKYEFALSCAGVAWCADMWLGLGSFLLGTNPDHCRSHSKSCPKYRTGRTSCSSHGQTYGMSGFSSRTL
jgi:essential nuclear protein 1